VYIYLVLHVLAQNVPSLDVICNLIDRNNIGMEGNLIDRNNIGMEGNDCNTDDATLLQ
jgi:hypothetical protein